MTLPDERYRALHQLPGTLIQLAFSPGKVTKREFRDVVRMVLRHYPTQYELEVMAKRCPNLLQFPKKKR